MLCGGQNWCVFFKPMRAPLNLIVNWKAKAFVARAFNKSV